MSASTESPYGPRLNLQEESHVTRSIRPRCPPRLPRRRSRRTPRPAGGALGPVTAGHGRGARRAAVAEHRALRGRTRGRGDGRPRSSRPVLHGGGGWRDLEEHGLRPPVDQSLRRRAAGIEREHRRSRGRPLQSAGPLRRHGRERHSRRYDHRGRRVPLGRRRHDVDGGRAGRHAHDQRPGGGPEELRRGLRLLDGPRVRARAAPRRVQVHRWREDVDEGAVRERQHGRDRPRDGPTAPRRAVRGGLAGLPEAMEAVERRPGKLTLQDDGRRTALDEALGQPGLPRGRAREDRGGRRGQPAERGLRHRPGEAGRGVPLRRRRRHLEPGQRRLEAPATRLLLHGHLRRPEGPEHRLHARGGRAVRVARRRQELLRAPHAARGQPHAVDRPRRPEHPARGERRRGDGLDGRRQELEHGAQPAHGPVLQREPGPPVPLPRVRRAAGRGLHRGTQLHEPRRDPAVRLEGDGLRREHPVRARAGEPGRHLRKRLLQHLPALRRFHVPVPEREPVAELPGGSLGRRAQVPVRVDAPDPVLTVEAGRAVRRLAVRPAQPGPRPQLDGHQPRPDAKRPGHRSPHRRAHRPGPVGRRDLPVRIRPGRVPEGRRRDLGGLLGRARARDAGRRGALEDGHAAGAPEGVPDERDRALARGRRHGLHGGAALHVGRLHALRVQDHRLRGALDVDHQGTAGRPVCVGHPPGPARPRPPVPGDPDHRVREPGSRGAAGGRCRSICRPSRSGTWRSTRGRARS